MTNMDKEMYDTWQRLLREDGHLRGTDFFAFRLGWLECKAAQQSVQRIASRRVLAWVIWGIVTALSILFIVNGVR